MEADALPGDGFDDVCDVIHLIPALTILPSLEPEEEKGS
jgi:hypothetical protein